MNGNNGHDHTEPVVDENGLPGPGLWVLFHDGDVSFVAQTTKPTREADLLTEQAAAGCVKLTLRTKYLLYSVCGAMMDNNRTPTPFTLSSAQSHEQRLGLPDEVIENGTYFRITYVSSLSPASIEYLRTVIEHGEKVRLQDRAKRAGISLPTSMR